MAVLVAFAVLAGAGTALTPCVLPVLPALLSASATGGRRRPLGVILGLTVTFVVAIVGIATVIDGVGLASGATRTLAIVVPAALRAGAWCGRGSRSWWSAPSRASRASGPRSSGIGFWSGRGGGRGARLPYAPCAGPILAAVISVAATGGAPRDVVLVAIGYGLGSPSVLLALASAGGGWWSGSGARAAVPALQRALGVVMVLTAVAMATELDLRFQTALANDLPVVHRQPHPARSSAPPRWRTGWPTCAGIRGSTSAAHAQLAAARWRGRYPVLGGGAGVRRRRAVAEHARRPAAEARGPAGAAWC